MGGAGAPTTIAEILVLLQLGVCSSKHSWFMFMGGKPVRGPVLVTASYWMECRGIWRIPLTFTYVAPCVMEGAYCCLHSPQGNSGVSFDKNHSGKGYLIGHSKLVISYHTNDSWLIEELFRLEMPSLDPTDSYLDWYRPNLLDLISRDKPD